MKTVKYLFAAVLVAVVCTGCTTYGYTSRAIDIIDGAKITTSDLLVDIRPDFSRRVIASSDRHKSATVAMEEAKYRAVVDNKIDIVVDPIYRVEKRGGKFMVSLTGFAGFYENARSPKDEIKDFEKFSKETIEKKLMMEENEIVLRGMYDKKEPECCRQMDDHSSQIIIHHNCKCNDKCDKAPAEKKVQVVEEVKNDKVKMKR